MTRRTSALAALAAVTAAAVTGCGVTTDGAIRELRGTAAPEANAEIQVTPSGPVTATPAGAPGVVAVDGVPRGSLTTLARRAYADRGGRMDVRIATRGEDAAFAAMCAGRVDLVDSSRPISRAELSRCRSAGLTPVQLQIAADAVVVATKAGTDIGADCLTLAQLRGLYRAGSPVYDWSQLGFDDVPVDVGGPDAENNAFSFFGRAVLGAAEPSRADLRSDYRAAATDRESRRFIVGDRDDALLLGQRELRAARVRSAGIRADRARASAEEARRELRSALRDRRKGRRDERSGAQQGRDDRRVARARTALRRAEGDLAAKRGEVSLARRAAGEAAAAARRQARLRGRVSYFRFTYYELYEDQLRPLEISTRDGAARSCTYPSQQSITDGTYPLARQLLITTTTAGLRREEVRSFLRSYLVHARRLAVDHRLVPLPQSTVARQLAWVSGERRPTIVVDPSAPVPTGEG